MAKQPLHGLTIAVTRPREQAMKMLQRIEQAGGVPLLFPLLEITAIEDADALNGQIAHLGQFNLAIFISPNAVRYGIAAIRESGFASAEGSLPAPRPLEGRASGGVPFTGGSSGEPAGLPLAGGNVSLPPNLKIAAVGQGSAQALREAGIPNIIAPAERFDSEGLLAEPELQNVSGWRVMIFRGDGGRELLGNTLRERGATVEYVSCYQRGKPQHDKSALLAAEPDAIIVTSSEALGYLWQMLNDNDRAALRNTALFVPHARIAGLAREQGWPQVHMTASGDDGMFSALITWAGQRLKGEAGLNR